MEESCNYCRGTGQVECDCTGQCGRSAAESDCPACGGSGMHTCPSCHGSGRKDYDRD